MKRTVFSATNSARSAFTLVELLVVIGIIALLIGILLPTLSQARRAAGSVACLSNQRQLGQGLIFFVQEHDNYLPKIWFNDFPSYETYLAGSPDWGFRDPLWGWDYVLKSKYLDGSNDVFGCYGDSSNLRRGEWNDGWNLENKLDDNIPASYRYNWTATRDSRGFIEAVKITRYADATKKILISDGYESTIHGFATDHGQTVADGSTEVIGAKPEWAKNAAPYRHTAQGNVVRGSGDNAEPVFTLNAAFVDGHAESVTWVETFTPLGEPVKFNTGVAGSRTPAVGIRTLWRQNFDEGSRIDTYDNPYSDADDGNSNVK